MLLSLFFIKLNYKELKVSIFKHVIELIKQLTIILNKIQLIKICLKIESEIIKLKKILRHFLIN